MNKLEQKIFEEFDRFESHSLYITKQEGARLAAKITLQMMERAYRQGTADEFLGKVSTNERDYFEDLKQEIL